MIYPDRKGQMSLLSRCNHAAYKGQPEDEVLNVHAIKFDDAMAMVYNGTIQDSKTISGLFLADYWLNR